MTAHSRIAPDWPRLMTLKRAAIYCDMTAEQFEREVARDVLPQPVRFGKELRWDRSQLDEAIDRLTGRKTPDWRKGSKLYASS